MFDVDHRNDKYIIEEGGVSIRMLKRHMIDLFILDVHGRFKQLTCLTWFPCYMGSRPGANNSSTRTLRSGTERGLSAGRGPSALYLHAQLL